MKSFFCHNALWVTLSVLASIQCYLFASLFIQDNPATGEWDIGPQFSPNDLIQHYVACQLVLEENMKAPYQIARLGEKFIFLYPDSEYTENFKGDHYLYPPPTLAFHYVLSILAGHDYTTFADLWSLFSILLYISAGGLLLLQVYFKERLKVLLLLLSFPGFSYTLGIGQNGSISLLVITFSGFLVYKKKFFLAGGCIGLLAYKPQLILCFLPFLFFLNKRILLGALSMLLVGGTLSFIIFGLEVHQDWLNIILNHRSEAFNHFWGCTWLSFVQSFLKIDSPLIGLLLAILSISLGIGLFFFIGSKTQAKKWPLHLHFYFATALAFLFSPYLLFYDLILFIPFVGMILERHQEKNTLLISVLYALTWGAVFFSILGESVGFSYVAPSLSLIFVAYLLTYLKASGSKIR
ncbi:MAG: glycosyltransferase family 87 protein [Verrucomicrobiota bacterium]